MGRPDLVNPVAPSTGDQELFRAMESLIDQLRQRDEQAGRTFSTVWYGTTLPRTVHLIPRVGKEGYGLGRVTYIFTADTTFSSSDYYTFTLYRYFTDIDGVRQKRLVPSGAWGTNTYAPRADLPFALELDHELDPGDTLLLDIAIEGVPVDAEFSVQVDEMFGPEE